MSGEVVDNVAPDVVASDNVTPTPEVTDSSVGDWREGLSEDLKGNPTLDKFTSLEALANSYVNAERLIGKEKIPMPETDDDWSNLYNRLGRPESNDGYKLEIPEEISEIATKLGAEDDGWFRETAHKLGLTQDQTASLFGEYWNHMAEQSGELDNIVSAEFEKSEESLKNDWRNDFEPNLKLANRALADLSEDVFGDETFVNHLKDRGLDNDPVLAKVLFHIGKGNLEDGQPVDGSSGMTYDGIKASIAEMQGSKAYTNKNDPGHAVAVREMKKLFEQLHPEEAA